MPANFQTESGTSVTELVTGIVHDAQTLLEQQLALFKQEMREDIQKTRDAITSLALSSGLLLVGAILLSLMLVHLLFWLVPSLPLWACFGIVGGVLAVLGGILGFQAQEQLRTVNPAEKTAKGLKENLEWKTKPT